MREEVTDQYGNVIYLTDERWQHIVENHSKLNGCRDEVLSTIRSGKHRQDEWYPNKFYYNKKFRRPHGGFKEIEVVVVFHWKRDEPNNFILTAYQI